MKAVGCELDALLYDDKDAVAPGGVAGVKQSVEAISCCLGHSANF